MTSLRRWAITIYAVAIFSVLELPAFLVLSSGSLADFTRAMGGIIYLGTWVAWLVLLIVAIWQIRRKAIYLLPSAAIMLLWPIVGIFALRQFNLD